MTAGRQPGDVQVWATYTDKRTGKEVPYRRYVHPDKAHMYQQTPPAGFKPKKGSAELKPEQRVHPDDTDREHSHSTAKGETPFPHKVSLKHNSDYANQEHGEERAKYHKDYFGEFKPSWEESLKVTHEDKRIRIGNVGYEAEVFNHPQAGKSYLVDIGSGFNFIVPQKNIMRAFIREKDALEAVHNFYENTIQKSSLLDRINKMIQKADILFRADNLIKSEAHTYSEYQSGDNKVALTGTNGHYSVSANGADLVKNTENFSQAISKFYHCIKNFIQNEVEDADQALDLFGEQVVSQNRRALTKLAELGKMDEAKLLKNFDYSILGKFFENSLFQRAIPADIFVKYEHPGSVFEMIPPNEEKDDVGREPRRQELKEKEYHAEPKKNLNQEPIMDDSKAFMNPTGFAKADELNQYQNFPVKELEEDKRFNEIQQPVKSSQGPNKECQKPISEDRERPILNPIYQSFLMINKDFPKMAEETAKGDQIGYIPGHNRIGDKEGPISKAAFSLHAPEKNPQKPIEAHGEEYGISKEK